MKGCSRPRRTPRIERLLSQHLLVGGVAMRHAKLAGNLLQGLRITAADRRNLGFAAGQQLRNVRPAGEEACSQHANAQLTHGLSLCGSTLVSPWRVEWSLLAGPS